MNLCAPKLQSRSHWQKCSNVLIYEFWGAVSEFNKRTDKSFFDVRVRTDADEYDCKRHWKCHWCLTKVLFRFTTNVPTCSVCQIYENFPTFELFRQPWINFTEEPNLLVYKETGKQTLSYVFNTDMRLLSKTVKSSGLWTEHRFTTCVFSRPSFYAKRWLIHWLVPSRLSLCLSLVARGVWWEGGNFFLPFPFPSLLAPGARVTRRRLGTSRMFSLKIKRLLEIPLSAFT